MKEEVDGRIHLGPLGLAGDEQADTLNHGGPDKAVLVFARHRYDDWRRLGLDLPEGGFFENVTLEAPGVDESTVVLGETWRLGGAVVQVTQPRSPCYKLARRWGIDDMVRRAQQTGWVGWYLRVVEPGAVARGDDVELLERPSDAPSVGEVSRVLNRDKRDLDGARRLIDAPGMPARWVAKLARRVAGSLDSDEARRLGPDA
uniref:MOSC domain-containing protein n=1 Tax=Tessaracoccus bendigoensis TaxID=72764 RepID=UPI001C31C54D|nr:MOSC domain-containing protein [Tessaracoccus bendigoensis]